MKKYLSDEEIKLKLETLLKDGLKKDNLIIYDDTFKLGVNYYFNELVNLSKRCVFGLSIRETLILREKLGINEEKRELESEEIKRKYEIKDIGGIFNYSLMMLRRNIKNINTILDKELKEEPKVYKTLLGELNLSKKTFGLLQSYNIYTLGDLIGYSKSELLKFRNIGKSNVHEIIVSVNTFGFNLKDEDDQIDENDYSIKEPSKEHLDILNKEEIERKKRDLELEKLQIKRQRIAIDIANLLKQQAKIDEEIQALIENDKLKK